MAKKKDVDDSLKELKTKINTATIGTDRVMKELKAGNLSTIYLAKNCRADVKGDIEYYASLSDVPVVVLDMDNEELGVFCKKNFFISVLGV